MPRFNPVTAAQAPAAPAPPVPAQKRTRTNKAPKVKRIRSSSAADLIRRLPERTVNYLAAEVQRSDPDSLRAELAAHAEAHPEIKDWRQVWEHLKHTFTPSNIVPLPTPPPPRPAAAVVVTGTQPWRPRWWKR